MTWAIERDGYKAEWLETTAKEPFVRVTGPGINNSPGMEYAIPAHGTHDGCDFMHACITYSIAAIKR